MKFQVYSKSTWSRATRYGICRNIHLRCCASSNPDPSPAEDGKSMEALAQEIIDSDPEVMNRLQRVGDAARRVAELQAEQQRLAVAIAEANSANQETARAKELAANENLADAEERAAKLMLRAAELQAEDAAAAVKLVSLNADDDEERIESAKAGVAAGIGGAIAVFPLLLLGPSPTALPAVLELLTAGVSGFLFGVTYRYAVRDDDSNAQLRGGVVAAFGLVRGIAAASSVLLLPDDDMIGRGALAMGESMLLFAFAAVAVEAGFRMNYVKQKKM
jgi:hypothetical protein